MILSKKGITKALVSLRRCSGWSGCLLFANSEDRFSRVEAHIRTDCHDMKSVEIYISPITMKSVEINISPITTTVAYHIMVVDEGKHLKLDV